MKKVFALVSACLLLAVLLPCQVFAAKAEVTLKVHHFLPAKSNAQVLLIQPWADKITAESNGRIAVEIYPSMQLGGKPPHLFNQVKDGVADVVWTLPSYTPGRFPITDLFELPYLTASAEATTQAIQEFSETYLKEEYGQVHPLLFHVPTPGLFHTASKQIKTMADLKGMKIRTPSAIVTQSLEALGATPVGMPVPEVPQAMATEVIDGAVVPWEVVKALRLHELTKFHTQSGGSRGFYTSVFLFAMNKAKYDSLPADLKKVIDDNSGKNLAQKIGKAYDQADLDGQKLGKERNNTFYTLSTEEVHRWEKATLPVIDTWVKKMDEQGHDGKKMLAVAREMIKKYSKD